MAKAFFDSNSGGLVKIALDSDVAHQNIVTSDYTEKTLSDEEFNSLKQNLKEASLVDNSISFKDLSCVFETENQLKNYLQSVVLKCIELFLENNKSNSMWNGVNTYKIEVEKIINDEVTLTYPVNSSWEKYCEDNSITYYHPLQIP